MKPEPTGDLQSFTLKDARGSEHKYETVLLPARKGLPLSLSLVKALGEPLMALLGDAGGLGAIAGAPEADDVNLKALGPALKGLDPSVLTQLAFDVLSTTIRDGRRLVDQDFDKAYRGNYLELYSAVWKVVVINRLVPLPSTSDEAEETSPPQDGKRS